uniref:Uncharacterized protein LOC101502871 n=1 Tax=Cicer arietinum TaxID=3827 RepID=A0A1S2Y221_CICAR|nr:uncharacterized protein LOC101502871 [Cicer arietinum]
MRLLLGAQEVFEIVQDGYEQLGVNPTERQQTTFKDCKKRYCKTLFYIQQSVNSNNFERILKASTSKEMRTNGESLTEVMIIEKILRTLTQRYDHIVVAIEESKDLDKMKVEDLQASLEVDELRVKREIKFADNSSITAEGVRKMLIQMRDGKQSFICDVLYVPNMKNNLLSLGQLLEKGYSMKIEQGEMRLFDSSRKLILKAPLSKNRTFKIDIQINESKCLAAEVRNEDWKILVFLIKRKNEVFEMIKKFKIMAEKQSGFIIKIIRTYEEGKYNSHDFHIFCEKEGILHEVNAPCTPQHNGTAEKRNKNIVNMAKSMLMGKKMPHRFWREAVSTAVYILNRCPTKRLDTRTPEEAWTGRKPIVNDLRVFGS